MTTHGLERAQARKSARKKTVRKASRRFDAQRLGNAIRVIREGRDLNQSQFATLTGLTRTAVAILEAGSVEPTLTTLEKVAAFAGLQLPEIVALGVESRDTIDPRAKGALGLLLGLNDRSLGLALSLLAALAKHRDE